MKKFVRILLVTAVTSLAQVSAEDVAPPTLSILDVDAMDRTAEPCVNFYQYACGGWHQDNPIPANESFWSRPFTQFKRRVDEYVISQIEAAAVPTASRTTDEQKLGDYFAACMDTDSIDARGITPLADELAIIERMESVSELPRVVGQLQRVLPWYPQDGEPLIFLDARPVADGGDVALRIGSSGLGLASPRYYLDLDDDGRMLLKKYREHIQNMFQLVGESEDVAKMHSKAVLALETALASARTPRSELTENPARIRNRMTLAELQELTPSFDWSAMFQAHGLPDRGDVNPRDIDFLIAMNDLITEVPLEDWQVYLKWAILTERTKSLPFNFRDERFRFFGEVILGLSEAPTRQQECMDSIKIDLPAALGRMFVDRAFDPKMREDAESVFEEIRMVMRERVRASQWMAPETIEEAIRKIDATSLTIGYPPTWLDESRVVIRRDDHYGNVIRTGESMRRVLFDRVGNPPDLDWWDEPVTWVGGYYQAAYNSITVTTAMMLTMENLGDDPALYYAGLGVFLAHELIHGFDTGGRHYDANGDLRDWWTESDEGEFNARAECVSEQFSTMEYAPGIPIDGNFVVAEQFTEISAQTIAWEAYKRATVGQPQAVINGMTPRQRYFAAAAQTWCAAATDGGWLSLANGGSAKTWGAPMVHGTVTNLPEFAKAFDCKVGKPMVKEPKEVCSSW